jgi:hypothetical protein
MGATMTVPNLMLYSDNTSFRKYAATVGAVWDVKPRELKPFKSLKDMTREITKHQFIDQLVIFTHGFTGGMSLEDGHDFNLNDEAVVDAFAKVKTQVDHIRFEGCWVGNGPDDMRDFGRLLRAVDVSGYTWEHADSEVTVTITAGMKAAELDAMLRPYWRWLSPSPPQSIAQLASLARAHDVTRTLKLEWYKYSDNATDPTPPWTAQGGNGDVLGPYGYKRRADAKHRVVQPDDAKTNTEPSPPFEYVTVELHLGGRILDF